MERLNIKQAELLYKKYKNNSSFKDVINSIFSLVNDTSIIIPIEFDIANEHGIILYDKTPTDRGYCLILNNNNMRLGIARINNPLYQIKTDDLNIFLENKIEELEGFDIRVISNKDIFLYLKYNV